MRDDGSRAPAFLAAAAVVIVTIAIVALASTGALAGDNVASFSFEPDAIEADPGEEVTVPIVLRSHGGYGGAGVEAVSLALEYDPEILSVTALEAGPWLAEGAAVETDERIDREAGLAQLDQRREPAGEGVTGTATIATATVSVAPDAEATNATLSIGESAVDLVSGQPQPTMSRDVVVVVDGGGERSSGDGLDTEGVTLAEDVGEPRAAPASEDGESSRSLSSILLAGAAGFLATVGGGSIALRLRDRRL